MRLIHGLITAGAALLIATSAQAQTNGWYVGGELGANKANDSTFSGSGQSYKLDYDWGYGILGQVGYGFGQIRTEGELGWRTNGVDKVNGVNGSGDGDVWTLMGNVYYDFATGTKFTPFIGAGLGAARLEADGIRQGSSNAFSGDETVFAYQGILGLAYDLDSQVSLKADYRYLDTLDGDFNGVNGGKVEGDYSSHAIMVGFTYKFGAEKKAAPAPVAAVAPAPAPKPTPAPTPAPLVKNYLVFFDFNKSDITPEASTIITEAAATAKKGNIARVELTGHADRSGSDKYNMALSLKRANAVKDAMIKQGIPANQISVIGKGEAAPLVQTKDGVREPQNRRVEIVLQ